MLTFLACQEVTFFILYVRLGPCMPQSRYQSSSLSIGSIHELQSLFCNSDAAISDSAGFVNRHSSYGLGCTLNLSNFILVKVRTDCP